MQLSCSATGMCFSLRSRHIGLLQIRFYVGERPDKGYSEKSETNQGLASLQEQEGSVGGPEKLD